ncbi:DNA-processing protein DprA [Sciscionella sediminilitoris]|uniref:DNA-processing protein DprA n=1 Tax=Sciscionella sediminilitoris TaxID=1445613 RepID=UPI0005653DB1|nr:DNA-processing protein DprA [Sciscionella sp. SE31]
MTGSNPRTARAYLLRVAEPPAIALRAFVARHGPERAAELVRAGQVPVAVDKETSARRHLDRAARDLEHAAAAGARLVTPEDEEWPSWRFLALELAARRGVRYSGEPIGLWARGRALTGLGDRTLAVVGARAATRYGEHVATDLAHGLAQEGVGVVSGAAYGIDGAAHKGALAAGGTTAAVLACGIDVPYPAGHARLLEHIAEHGSVVSEYPPGTKPARYRFLARNRLIAALGDGTLVVEAGRRSGARNTAATAHAIGRPVLAVPGPITSAMSLGCHQLLRDGDAALAGNLADVRAAIGPFDASAGAEPAGEIDPVDELDQEAKRVLETLGRTVARDPEQVAAATGIELASVRANLTRLELSGLARNGELGWQRIVALSAADAGRHTAHGT